MRIVWIGLAIIFIGFSCKKKEQTEEEKTTATYIPPTVLSYPLDSGNYWIYDYYSIIDDTIENYTRTDSFYVYGDTIIRDHIYYQLIGSPFTPSRHTLQRDSFGYVVDSRGTVLFSEYNFIDTLDIDTYPRMAIVYYTMAHRDSIVEVPAGTFTTIDYMGTQYSLDTNYRWPSPRYSDYFYAKGVGAVLYRDYYYSSPNYVEQRLVRYHIN